MILKIKFVVKTPCFNLNALNELVYFIVWCTWQISGFEILFWAFVNLKNHRLTIKWLQSVREIWRYICWIAHHAPTVPFMNDWVIWISMVWILLKSFSCLSRWHIISMYEVFWSAVHSLDILIRVYLWQTIISLNLCPIGCFMCVSYVDISLSILVVPQRLSISILIKPIHRMIAHNLRVSVINGQVFSCIMLELIKVRLIIIKVNHLVK